MCPIRTNFGLNDGGRDVDGAHDKDDDEVTVLNPN